MKTIPMVPACQNIEELQKLTSLICEFIHPDMVILFGHYAGMTFHDAVKGYEMLILVNNESSLAINKLMGYLKIHYPIEGRLEKHLSLHLFTSEYVHHHTSLSYFLYTIRKEGVLLYQDKYCKLKENVSYKPKQTYQQVSGFVEQCFALGNAFLQDAQRQREIGIPRIAAFYLCQAFTQYLRAANVAHYGFLSEEGKNDLISSYIRIRYCTKEIAVLWLGEGKLSEWRLFGRIQSFTYKTRYSYPYSINSDLLDQCLTLTKKLEKATEQFCKERLQFLASMVKKKSSNI